MRSSGYRDSAYALAELIDNSIQAGLQINDCTHVEVLCIDKVTTDSGRKRQRMERVGVYDNACGMPPDVLRIALQFGNGSHKSSATQKGIGKFGMGLPNASISQCCRLEVWSWCDGKCFHTYLDVDEVSAGSLRQVPEPTEAPVPEFWRSLIRDKIGPHGTLVVWSRLDRVRWKTSGAFLRNTEFLIGRIYRYFLNDKTARVRLASFEDTNGAITNKTDNDALPNDPLYLMRGTLDPKPYNKEPAFDQFAKYHSTISVLGEEHLVHLTFSVVKKKARHEGGQSKIGKYAAKNQGVSVVRAGRELELNSTFDNTYDPRERWWGVEVSFEPALDDVFGVTNNKQAATAFKILDLDEDAKAEGMSPQEYREELEAAEDPRLAMYEISKEINNRIKEMREQIQRIKKERRSSEVVTPPPGSAEDIATKATERRKQELGTEGESDKDEKLPVEEKERVLTEEFVEEGHTEEEAREIAVEWAKSQTKFIFKEGNVPGPAFFDIRSRAGKIFVVVNQQHPAKDGLFELLREEDGVNDTPALSALKLLLEAWARLEDEAGSRRRQVLEEVRIDWGRIARDFLQEAEDG